MKPYKKIFGQTIECYGHTGCNDCGNFITRGWVIETTMAGEVGVCEHCYENAFEDNMCAECGCFHDVCHDCGEVHEWCNNTHPDYMKYDANDIADFINSIGPTELN